MDTETTCESCEQPLARHQGPGVASRYEFPVLEVALALVRVGRGMSYSEAARRAQVRTARGSSRGSRPTAQLVGNWVEVFGPVVAEGRKETAWPETVVIDAKEFHANLPGGASGAAFTVLAAWGYETGQAPGRLVAVRAEGGPENSAKWNGFLRSLPGAPRMVVSDDADKAIKAVRAVFSSTTIRLCRWHLKRNLTRAMGTFATASATHPLRIAAESALDTVAGWANFQTVARQYGRTQLTKFIKRADPYLTAEFAAHQAAPNGLPDHWSNGAVEQALKRIDGHIGRRAFTLRNAKRTNRLLELIRLHENRWDDVGSYSAAIREHLHAGGPLTPQLTIKDPLGQPSLR